MDGQRACRGTLAVMVLACALVFAFASSAFAAEQNPECLTCHSSIQTWNVAPVDKATACVKCHTPGLLGTHPYHNPGSDCGAVCHMPEGWGTSNRFATPAWSGAAGSFAGADSVDTSPEALHIIHATPRWMDDLSTGVSECDSCHAPAACSSCHEDDPSTDHAPHGMTGNVEYTARTPWTGVMAGGIVGEDQSIRSAVETESACASAECHDIDGTKTRNAVTRESHSHKALAASPQTDTVALSGTPTGTNKTTHWTPRYNSNLTLGTALYSSALNASLTTTFTGSGVDSFEILADKDPYRGQAEVIIDGVSAGTLDCYAPATAYQQVVFRSGVLAAGPHTVTVKVLRAKQAAARDYFVHVDGFRVFGDLPATIAPKCASCHPDKTAAHGTSFAHEASMTVGTYPAGRFQCNQCHKVTLLDEHKRSSSVSEAGGCASCHETYAPKGFTPAYDYTCSWSAYGPGCHQAANNQAPHTAIATAHNATEAATQSCRDCHGSDLGVIHDDTNAARLQHASLSGAGSNGLAYATDCLTCHGPNKYPTTTDCTDAACHAGSGVVSIATHPAPAHNGTNNNAGVARTGGKTCSTCHDIELVGEHAKTSSVGAGGAIDCLDCHTATYLPAGWFATPGTTNTCIACHKVGGGAPTATTAGEAHEAADYGVKHDFSAYASNWANCSGTQSWCHDVTMVDVIHDAAPQHGGDCTSCHADNTSVPSVRGCATCHTAAHPAYATSHATSGSAECIACHVFGASMSSNQVHKGGCEQCHDNPSYPGITDGRASAACVDCHNSGLVANPMGGSGGAYTTPDPKHYSETTHTATPFTAAVQGVGGDGVVPAEGKECSTCHTASLKIAHATTSTNGGSVTCAECHGDTSLNSSAVIAGGWANDKCKDCHDAGAATTHAAYGTTHVVAAGTCAGTGTGCHNFTDLAKLHNVDQAGGAANYASCSNTDAGDPTGCHADKDARPARWASDAASCGQGTSGCHTEKSAVNHGKKHTLDLTASDAAGCTNNLAGCHGSGQTSTDIADYHQTTECATSGCHESASKPTHNQPFVCTDCHDGTYVGAADTAPLTTATTAGHYGETTHTVAGLGVSTSGAAGGTVSATCSDCHDGAPGAGIGGLYKQHQGVRTGSLTCTGCHNENAAIQTIVTDAVRDNTCAACHKAGVVEVVHATGTAPAVIGTESGGAGSCVKSGCHTSLNLHELHKGKAGGKVDSCAETGCHDFSAQGAKPAAKSCGTTGACHTVDAHDPTKHAATQSAECIGCHKTTDITVVHAGQCSLCHGNAGEPTLPVGDGATLPSTTADCVNCHGDEVGSHAYTPADPNHATGNEGTHTAAPFTAVVQGAGGDGVTPAEGKECSTCHTATLKVAHSSTSTSGGSVTCTECHLNTSLNSSATVAAGWPAKKCKDCHDSGAATTHATYSTAHVVPAGTCASTGASCHNYTDLAKLHDKNQSGGAPTALSCGNVDAGDPTACHNVKDDRPTRWASDADSCGEGTSGCHTDKSATNHGKKHTLTLGSSVYADGAGQGVEAGCLSSGGGGCHDGLGAGNTSVDIADYHQTALCATSVCHTSASKPTHTQPFVCGDCHDSTYIGATDTTALGDLDAAGHYPVTAHTATGGLGNVKVTGGAAQETCSVCHDLSLKTAHTGIDSTTKGTKVTCGECHGYSLNITNEIKVASWSTNACSDCHNATFMAASTQHLGTVAASVAATGSVGCASSGNNCHASNDLHAIHKDASTGCDLSGCHDAASKNNKPVKKSCGSGGTCHATGFNTGTSFPTHGNDPSEEPSHAPTGGNTAQETATWSISGTTPACGACHLISSADGGLRAEHILGTSTMTVSAGDVCLNCHNSPASTVAVSGDWANRNTASACLDCHTAGNGIAIHANAENAPVHTDVTSPSCGNTGGGCHPTNNLAQVGTPSTTANIHTTCLRCHDHTGSATVPAPGGGNMKWDPTKDTCGVGAECHNIVGQYPVAGDPIHRGGLADVANGDDTTHHTGVTANKTNYPETAAGVFTDNQTCAACHSNTLKLAHSVTSTNGGAVTCAECHNGSGTITAAVAQGQVKTTNWAADKCTDCHASASTHASFKTGAATYSANHVATQNASCAGSGLGCHGSRPESSTVVAPAGEMAQLHPTRGCSASSGTSATSCHALNKPVASIAKTCGSGGNCHAYTTTAGHAAGTITGNEATHTVTVASMDATADVAFTYGVQCKNCHSLGLRSAHTTVTVSMESGTTSWTAGASPYCIHCHNTAAPDNATKVIKTTTWGHTCDECHVANGNGRHSEYGTASLHNSTPGAGCTQGTCHGGVTNVRTIHNKVSSGCTVSGTDGESWTGACHQLDKQMPATMPGCGSGSAGCHTNHTATNHGGDHDADKTLGAAVGSTGQTYGYGTNVGCFGCHYSDLREEHAPAGYASGPTGVGAGRTMEGGTGGTDGCGVCHTDKGTPGTYASGASVVTARTNKDLRCTSCHNNGTAADVAGSKTLASPHKVTGAGHADPAAEFVDGAQRGGHNSMGGSWFPNTTGFGTVNTVVNPSWPLPPASEFLLSPWTTTSTVLCSDCHSYTAATGPQGAAVKMLIDPLYGQTAYSAPTVSNWSATGTSRPICAKCHNLSGMAGGTSQAHSNHSGRGLGSGGACKDCHLMIPHAWKRPRLLPRTGGGTTIGAIDTAPYVEASRAGLIGFNVRTDMTPSGWAGSNCQTGGCKNHSSAPTPYWP